ncbi:MAG: M20/M25/M40 family metallo-hydrolase, partial [Planctomycetes bacterium]|nr:M20/M25/M40 family metallo-hydrolase [Planctomycetota bacterium]
MGCPSSFISSAPPIHISSADDRKKIPEIAEFFVDLGLSGKEARRLIKVGDFVVMDEPLIEVGNKIVSKALDNRVACWLGIEAVKKIAKSKTGHAAEIHVAFTTQEEVGLRGAKTASYAIQPDIGLGIDVTLACDTPGVPAQESVTVHGEGFGLHVKDSSFIADNKLVSEVETVAKKNRIPCQRTILARGGQDGAAAQQAAAGARAIGITVGTRYIHTVTEMIDRRDLAAARDFPPLTSAPSWQLLIPEPSTLLAFNTDKIQMQPVEGETLSIADAQWSDNLPLLFQEKVMQSFE